MTTVGEGPMTCSGAMTARCQRTEARPYRGGLWLCDTCAEVGRAHGMALDPLPAWLARAQGGHLRAKDYTRSV